MSPSITDWLMVGITFVYVVATIFICRANMKSAEATREQIAESKRQFEEESRAYVTVSFDVVRSGLLTLKIKNHGKRIANNIRVKIAPEFIANMQNKQMSAYAEKLSDSVFTLGIDQSLYVSLGTNSDLKQMASERLSIEIDYQDSVSKYHETTVIDLTQYFWILMYKSPEEDVYQEMKKVTKELQSINRSIQKIYMRIPLPEQENDHA